MKIDVIQAISLLRQGEVVALPTETVYGLAACLDQPEAIKRVFELKGRPSTNPLIIHVAKKSEIENYTSQTLPDFYDLAEAFWPGPLTLVLPILTDKVPSIVCANLPTAAFRIPAHDLTLEVLASTGPLVMPSANLSGFPSSTSAEHVEQDFGLHFPVLNGGPCQKGLESTILYYQTTSWLMLRRGALTSADLEKVLGYQPQTVTITNSDKPLCPGQLFRHYAPKAKLILGDYAMIEDAPYILGFNEKIYPATSKVLYLGSIEDAAQVAAHLYDALRQLDLENASWAWVDMDFPDQGLWKTIADRLTRASRQ